MSSVEVETEPELESFREMDNESEAMLESALVECAEKTQKEIDDEIKRKKERQVINICDASWRIRLTTSC